MIKISPSERLFIDVPRNGSCAEGQVTLTNTSKSSVTFRVSGKAEEDRPAKITGVSPEEGVIRAGASERVSVLCASDGCRGDEGGREWIPVMTKLLVRTRKANDGDRVDEDGAGLVVGGGEEEETRELDVCLTFTSGKELLLLESESVLSSTSSDASASNSSGKESSHHRRLISGIKELVSANEELRFQLDELECRRLSDLELLSAARREAEDARVSSRVTTHLVRQLEDLRASKGSLEDEAGALRARHREEEEHLAEKEARLRALEMERDRLARENRRLAGHFATEIGIKQAAEGPTPSSAPPSSSALDAPMKKSKGRTKAAAAAATAAEGDWSCTDESLLFFLKVMTTLFGGLTLLAAMNILFLDMTN